MDFEEIRRTVIIAIFSDSILLEKCVLKGGNALSLVHKIGSRSSLDVDFSLENDFDNLDEIRVRIFKALSDRFDAKGHVTFDETLTPKPSSRKPIPLTWGGYTVEFKIATREQFLEAQGNIEKLQKESQVIGPGQQRKLRIEFSKHEYCEAKARSEMDNFTIYVYTPSMIVIEKLRAICQQMPEYKLRPYFSARARDFYDIFSVISQTGLDLSTTKHLEQFKLIFNAKSVPLSLLPKIKDTCEDHRPDWPAVQQSVTGDLKDFDYYFKFVVNEVSPLELLWH